MHLNIFSGRSGSYPPVYYSESAPPTRTPNAASPGGAPRTATVLLTRVLERLTSQTGVSVLADATTAYERVPAPDIPAPDASVPPSAAGEASMEKELNALVRALPEGTLWVKLYLPAPPGGRAWKGDDVAAFAFAQARLFGTIGTPMSDGSIEILSKRVAKNDAPIYVAGLGLKPVYLLTNTRRQLGGANANPWSAASQEQWASMSPDERKQYGQQQAAWIASLPPEQRAQMLEQIRQHDKYFDSVKDPLEKMLGHDL